MLAFPSKEIEALSDSQLLQLVIPQQLKEISQKNCKINSSLGGLTIFLFYLFVYSFIFGKKAQLKPKTLPFCV